MQKHLAWWLMKFIIGNDISFLCLNHRWHSNGQELLYAASIPFVKWQESSDERFLPTKYSWYWKQSKNVNIQPWRWRQQLLRNVGIQREDCTALQSRRAQIMLQFCLHEVVFQFSYVSPKHLTCVPQLTYRAAVVHMHLLGGSMYCPSELSYRRVQVNGKSGNIAARMRRPAINFLTNIAWPIACLRSRWSLILISRCQNCFQIFQVAFALVVTKIVRLGTLFSGRTGRILCWQDFQG